MKKIIFSSVIVILIFFLYILIFSDTSKEDIVLKNVLFNTTKTVNPLKKFICIPNISKNTIKNISVSISAENSDTITYDLDNNDIIENNNGIIILIQYLVADKESTITINILKKDNFSITKSVKIKSKLTNDPPIMIFSSNDKIIDSKYLPNIIIKENCLLNKKRFFYLEIIYPTQFEHFFIPIVFDSKGNIRTILDKFFYEEKKNPYYVQKTEFIYNNQDFAIYINEKRRIVEDKIIIKDLESKLTKVINLQQTFNLYSSKGFDEDLIHPNSIFYDTNDNSIIASGRNIGIFKISLDGKLKWIIPSLSMKSKYKHHLKKYFLTAIDSKGNILDKDIQDGKKIFKTDNEEFEWPAGQHSVKLIDSNHIVCFDNGWINNNNNKGYSRAVIYEINEKNRTLSQVWQYGKELGKDFYSLAHGEVQILDKDTLFMVSPLVIEDTYKSKCVFKIINIRSKKIIFDSDIVFKNIYRHQSKNLEAYYDSTDVCGLLNLTKIN